MTDQPTTTAAQRGDSRPRWRTNDLIQRLRELDPTGERTVFLEIGREPSVDTDPLAGVYVEDGNAVWDSARQRIVLTNEEHSCEWCEGGWVRDDPSVGS